MKNKDMAPKLAGILHTEFQMVLDWVLEARDEGKITNQDMSRWSRDLDLKRRAELEAGNQ